MWISRQGGLDSSTKQSGVKRLPTWTSAEEVSEQAQHNPRGSAKHLPGKDTCKGQLVFVTPTLCLILARTPVCERTSERASVQR
eukprot:s1011_g6.t3